ncbi:hypothetical protein Patl1_20271 [Pistacia atlantica]|uniref:Uncharacterized protein n=1 Tax=Pistacia atlantica TaxID=434234 RepID=A0ACC1BIZ9_9ROSI|nr:hypothetical protein Patl1_20271 [Pistacia atlantica]
MMIIKYHFIKHPQIPFQNTPLMENTWQCTSRSMQWV